MYPDSGIFCSHCEEGLAVQTVMTLSKTDEVQFAASFVFGFWKEEPHKDPDR